MSGDFSTLVAVVVGSYIIFHAIFTMVLAVRGLTLKDMGLMGVMNHRLRAACKSACMAAFKELTGGDNPEAVAIEPDSESQVR